MPNKTTKTPMAVKVSSRVRLLKKTMDVVPFLTFSKKRSDNSNRKF
jgi:hypothetical protein